MNELFKNLEKRSLFLASEYLALSVLNNNRCTLNDDLAVKLESYRKMKVCATAPDIIFENNQKLSDIKTTKLVVFGASWCPTCKTDGIELLKQYDAWKTKGIELIYISIDTDKAAFETAYKNAPWQTYCDFDGWGTKPAKDYYVSGTPTYFLLDAYNKILVRPNSVAHANAWIDRQL
jgi:thiol-disulfide isomerase/thioredoxin